MSKIKPFKALLPLPSLVKEVVVYLENLTKESAKIIRNSNQNSFVHLLIPKLEHYYLQGSKKELAFKKIAENLNDFINNKILIEDSLPAIYVYQIKHLGLIQTGIWTCTAIDDYLNSTIKKHEHTQLNREQVLIAYLSQTGIDANPVLITYPPQQKINQIISNTIKNQPIIHFNYLGKHHQLWKINQPKTIEQLVQLFDNLDTVYLADGHHRAAAACNVGLALKKHNLKHNGTEEYNFFSSVYISTDQLKVYEFQRVIKSFGNLSPKEVLATIIQNFYIFEITLDELKPAKKHQFGFYFNHKSYRLIPKEDSFNTNNPLESLDVSILENLVLKPLLLINDLHNSQNLSFAGGLTDVKELVNDVNKGLIAGVFFLFPTAINELIKIADLGETMPPKSTSFEPKFLVGLVTHLINKTSDLQ